MEKILILLFSFQRMAEERHYLEERPIQEFIELKIVIHI